MASASYFAKTVMIVMILRENSHKKAQHTWVCEQFLWEFSLKRAQ